MNFKYHVRDLCTKATRQLGAVSRLQQILVTESKFAGIFLTVLVVKASIKANTIKLTYISISKI